MPGDEFALRQDGLFCRHDHDVLEGGKMCSGPGGVPGSENNNNASLMNNNHHLHPNDGSISGKETSTYLLLRRFHGVQRKNGNDALKAFLYAVEKT